MNKSQSFSGRAEVAARARAHTYIFAGRALKNEIASFGMLAATAKTRVTFVANLQNIIDALDLFCVV